MGCSDRKIGVEMGVKTAVDAVVVTWAGGSLPVPPVSYTHLTLPTTSRV